MVINLGSVADFKIWYTSAPHLPRYHSRAAHLNGYKTYLTYYEFEFVILGLSRNQILPAGMMISAVDFFRCNTVDGTQISLSLEPSSSNLTTLYIPGRDSRSSTTTVSSFRSNMLLWSSL